MPKAGFAVISPWHSECLLSMERGDLGETTNGKLARSSVRGRSPEEAELLVEAVCPLPVVHQGPVHNPPQVIAVADHPLHLLQHARSQIH